MSRSALVLGAAAVALLGVIAVRVAAPAPATAAAPPAAPAPASDRLAPGEASALRDELSRLRLEVASLRELSSRKGDGGAPPEEALTPARRDELRAAEQARWRAHMAEVGAAFEREPRDPRWAAATTDAVKAALGTSQAFAALARAVDCRSTTCRIELEHDADGVVDKQLPIFLNTMGGALPAAEADHEEVDGQRRYVLFLTRSQAMASAEGTR